MTDSPELPLESARLRLRAFSRGDVDAVLAYRGREDVSRYLADEPMSREMCTHVVRMRAGQLTLAEPGDRLALALERKEDGALIGEISLILMDRLAAQGEIGYVVAPDWQHAGYATEAAETLMAWGFDVFGLHRIAARCSVENVASRRVMERLGMRREAHFRGHALSKGRWLDEFVYALLADEWMMKRLGRR